MWDYNTGLVMRMIEKVKTYEFTYGRSTIDVVEKLRRSIPCNHWKGQCELSDK